MLDKKMSRRSFLTVSAMGAASLAVNWKKISAYAAAMGPKSDYPTVVIGAGLGGLCCAAYLARQGIPVTVVEQHSIPGGYATSFDRAEGKFSFEVSLHGTSIHNNASARILEELGVLDKLELVPLPDVYRLKTPDFDVAFPQKDPQACIRIMSERFPEEAAGIRGFFEKILAIADETEKYGQKSKFYKKYLKVIFPLQFSRMWNVRNKTLADLIHQHVKDEKVKTALAAMWGYYGLPPSLLSGFYYAVATGGYLKNGSYYIKERSQNLSNALAEVIEDAGGKIVYETAAEKVLVEKGVVKGVVVSGGETLPARAVVSNASAPTLFEKMLPKEAVPSDYLKKLGQYRSSISTFIVWLGLNRSLRGKVDGYSTRFGTGQGPEVDYQASMQGEIEKMSFSVTVYDNLFEGYSAPGTSSLMLLSLCGYEPWRRFEKDYRAGNKEAYNREKRRWTQNLIQKAEKHLIPGLSSMIEVQEAATPLTNWWYTGNPQGAIYGFEQSMDNAFMNRISNRTPVKGLYLASAWGNPGGGYTGVFRGGQSAFEMMMEDWGNG